MSRLRKPLSLGAEPSPFVEAALGNASLAAGSAVLDLGCGPGRHSLLLARAGHDVTAVDIDARRLDELGQAAGALSGQGAIARVLADGSGPLPFRDSAFDLVLAVDFVAAGFIAEFARVLRHGGYLVIQTFGGHGQNWQALPAPGQFRRELEGAFDVLDYRETPVGPTKREAASVRFLARRGTTPARDRTS